MSPEQWGRRWIMMDTSRVALALARGRIMGAHYPYYLLVDSPEGQRKEREVSRTPAKESRRIAIFGTALSTSACRTSL
jgi:adenine-specific DNA-methyltransferase